MTVIFSLSYNIFIFQNNSTFKFTHIILPLPSFQSALFFYFLSISYSQFLEMYTFPFSVSLAMELSRIFFTVELPYIFVTVELSHISVTVELSHIAVTVESSHISVTVEFPYISVTVELPYIFVTVELPHIFVTVEL